MALYRGQGKVYTYSRDVNGDPTVGRFLGNIPELELGFETDIEEHNESVSGLGLTDLRLLKKTSTSVKYTLEKWSKENIAMMTAGSETVIASGSVVAEPLPTVAVGDIVALKKSGVTNLVVEDDIAAALTLDTHYKINSANHGSIEILDIGAFTQPFNADYDNAGSVDVALLTEALPQVWLRFEGLNTADTNKPVIIEIYKFTYDPAKAIAAISEELASFPMEGGALYDDTKDGDAVLGQFGRIIMVA